METASPDPTTYRIWLALRVVAKERVRLGDKLIAAAIYGSVAHGAAGPHSDVELLLILADDQPAEDTHQLVSDVLVESTFIPETAVLTKARHVTPKWGLAADEHRHQLVLWDSNGFFPRLREAAHDLDPAAFKAALAEGWWLAFELRGKVLNALEDQDASRAVSCGWEFSYWAALRIALYEKKPYESGRTIWGDVIQRGYGVNTMVQALTRGDLAAIGPAIDAVWQATSWEGPDE